MVEQPSNRVAQVRRSRCWRREIRWRCRWRCL